MSLSSVAAVGSTLLTLVVVLTIAACGSLRPTYEPPIAGDPVGYVHIVSEPRQAPFPVTVFFRSPDGTSSSRVFFEFDPGQPILIVFPSTPGDRGLEVNGELCEGHWSIEGNVETDVIVYFDDSSCRIDVVGSHELGSVHSDPPTEPKLTDQ